MTAAFFKGFYTTPPIWKKEQFGLIQFQFPEVDLNTLPNITIPNNLRLGHQLEYVFKQLIQSSDSYKVMGHNLLIEEGKKRIGELDFILKRTEDAHYIHVELAYKFYIINPEISEPIYRLMGPNKRDMFYTKLDKLKEKQLPLLHHPSLSKHLEIMGCGRLKIHQRCCFKAQLFEPYGGEHASIRPLNPNCIVGKWIRFAGFNSEEFRNAFFHLPIKSQWVIAPHAEVPWMNHYETLMEVNLRMVRENAPLLWIKWPDNRLEKLFVVWW